MAVRSLQIRAKFITFIEIKAPRGAEVCEVRNTVFLSFETEHTHIVSTLQGFYWPPTLTAPQVWQMLDFCAVAFGEG